MNINALINRTEFFISLAQDSVQELEKQYNQSKERQRKFFNNLTTEQKEELYRTKHLRRKELMSGGSLKGLIVILSTKLKTLKGSAARAIKAKLAADRNGFFSGYVEAVKVAKDKLDQEPNPANHERLRQAATTLAKEMDNYIFKQPAINAFKGQLARLYDFRDLANFFDSLTNEPPPILQAEEVLRDIKKRGIILIEEFSKYGHITNVIEDIIKNIERAVIDMKTGSNQA